MYRHSKSNEILRCDKRRCKICGLHKFLAANEQIEWGRPGVIEVAGTEVLLGFMYSDRARLKALLPLSQIPIIHFWDMPTHGLTALHRKGYTHVDQISQLTAYELLDIRGFGEKSLHHVRMILREFDLSLREDNLIMDFD